MPLELGLVVRTKWLAQGGHLPLEVVYSEQAVVVRTIMLEIGKITQTCPQMIW